MISKLSRPVTKSLSRAPTVAKKSATVARRATHAVSRFEPVARKKLPQASPQHRRETVSTLWQLRSSLRNGDKATATTQARSLAAHLGVAVGSATRTAKGILTLIGRQLVHPEFKFRDTFDLGGIRHCASRSPSGKPNDPDPTSRWA